VAFLGLLSEPDPHTKALLTRHSHEAEQYGVSRPKDVREALDWLTVALGLAQARLQDPFFKELVGVQSFAFSDLAQFMDKSNFNLPAKTPTA
jgi:hypothetical protein